MPVASSARRSCDSLWRSASCARLWGVMSRAQASTQRTSPRTLIGTKRDSQHTPYAVASSK